jgi:hypothetical protein
LKGTDLKVCAFLFFRQYKEKGCRFEAKKGGNFSASPQRKKKLACFLSVSAHFYPLKSPFSKKVINNRCFYP